MKKWEKLKERGRDSFYWNEMEACANIPHKWQHGTHQNGAVLDESGDSSSGAA